MVARMMRTRSRCDKTITVRVGVLGPRSINAVRASAQNGVLIFGRDRAVLFDLPAR